MAQKIKLQPYQAQMGFQKVEVIIIVVLEMFLVNNYLMMLELIEYYKLSVCLQHKLSVQLLFGKF